MGIFWKRNRQRVLTDRQERLAERVASAIIRRQSQVAGYLNHRTQYWNKSSKVIALILFCLVCGGFSLYLLLMAIY